LWVLDEGHHQQADNKWGTAAAMFPNAKGLGVTATPLRGDGKGLGRHNDGLYDVMVDGPTPRELIDMGYLTDYRIIAPRSDLIIDDQGVGASGDWSRAQLKAAAKKSHIIGDVVGHYLKFARGKLGVTFATDVETATDIAERFNTAGVPAEVISAKTPDADRMAIMARFKRRELLQLVNVDILGEGVDVPAIEVVSMARPTQSFALFSQQFGRALRLMIDGSLYPIWDTLTSEERRAHIAASKKPRAIIIDHVGNVERMAKQYGLPDYPPVWSLDRRERRSSL
jgi:superfamily II DNA or RNA helicase